MAGNGAGEQRFAGAWRAHEQRALRHARAELRELCRVAQKFHDLFQLFFGFVDAGDRIEAGSAAVSGLVPRAQAAAREARHGAHRIRAAIGQHDDHDEGEADKETERDADARCLFLEAAVDDRV